MNGQEKFDKFIEKYPQPHMHCTRRPHLSRRRFFQIAGAGVTASYLANHLPAQDQVQFQVSMQNTAQNVIYILLAGAPSHTDLFDYKVVAQQPTAFAPTTINGVTFPAGLHAEARAAPAEQRLRHRPLHECLGPGALPDADLDADRPQSQRRAGQHLAQYRQRGGDRKDPSPTNCSRRSWR